MLYNNSVITEYTYHQSKPIAVIYHNGEIVWQGVRSCYGSGVWRNDMPWKNDDVWKN